ncbi:dolichyl-phosphate-mannose--protein mannosyltransferase [Knoellia koreensis]|jgi:dolichyl-phosphate-mannose--protein O-mannosyl transferase|uniref:Polyprenol-phosphate-mannose--protein mannosyltransferase n=1 Tax=Knoellia koreensis TaxID=2730921 RepID=A0A849HQ47_9MICO|nr:phospholipid carrier-dependent glycosyltransferase [Knoellia sp. DB2414S]NNM46717.1 phospholipid carrier-dependent glycosyltransferase [Knoellia sp. DB2414S]
MTRVDELRARLLGFRPTDTLWGWLGPLFFAAVGGVLRFWSLDRPHQLVFDETYYVKQGVSMLEYGVEMRVPDTIKKPDELFTRGTPDVFGTEGDLVVHPPVGKWVIAVGEQIFGQTSSWGWRFSVAVLGTLSILMIGRAARRMFGSSLLGTIAAFLVAFEGHHFVQSRTGLLDLIVMFWALAAFCALLIDRDRSREILAEKVAGMSVRQLATGLGPWLGWRPWRWVAGICLGLAAGTKWSGLFFLVAFGLMTVWWDLGARRAAGLRHWFWGTITRDGLWAALVMCGLTAITYVTSWVGWFRSDGGYDRQWAELNPGKGVQWLPPAFRSLWQYHTEIYAFHRNLHDDHPYKTNPWSWVIQGRPTSFFYEGPKRGEDGCTVAQCSKAITSLGTVSIWWLGAIAIFVCLYYWLFRRDWRAGAIVAGLVGGYLPWFPLAERTIYSFYTVAFEPWVIFAVVFVLGLVLGKRTDSWRRRELGLYAVGAFCLLTLALFAFFWPIYTAQVIPQSQWSLRMWFPSWV